MKLSARNVLKGKIKNIKRGPISSLVVLEIAPKVQIVSTITAESAAATSIIQGIGPQKTWARRSKALT